MTQASQKPFLLKCPHPLGAPKEGSHVNQTLLWVEMTHGDNFKYHPSPHPPQAPKLLCVWVNALGCLEALTVVCAVVSALASCPAGDGCTVRLFHTLTTRLEGVYPSQEAPRVHSGQSVTIMVTVSSWQDQPLLSASLGYHTVGTCHTMGTSRCFRNDRCPLAFQASHHPMSGNLVVQILLEFL